MRRTTRTRTRIRFADIAFVFIKQTIHSCRGKEGTHIDIPITVDTSTVAVIIVSVGSHYFEFELVYCRAGNRSDLETRFVSRLRLSHLGRLRWFHLGFTFLLIDFVHSWLWRSHLFPYSLWNFESEMEQREQKMEIIYSRFWKIWLVFDFLGRFSNMFRKLGEVRESRERGKHFKVKKKTSFFVWKQLKVWNNKGKKLESTFKYNYCTVVQ